MMKAVVDEATCTGCGLCAETCPEVFELDEGVARAIVAAVPVEAAAACREAAENCPVEAISLDE